MIRHKHYNLQLPYFLKKGFVHITSKIPLKLSRVVSFHYVNLDFSLKETFHTSRKSFFLHDEISIKTYL